MQEPVSDDGEDDLDITGVYPCTEDTSEGGDEGNLSRTGVDVPDDGTLPADKG